MRLRWVLLALIALVAIGGTLTQLKPASNSSPAVTTDCAGKAGVTLIVDFAGARKTEIKCAPKFSGTGWQLFAATKTQVSGTDQYPEGFVCRIEGYPGASIQGCHSTPTYSQGGWGYFYKSVDTGGKWVFSPTGSALRHPACGSIEGWRYFAPNESPAKTPPASSLTPFKC